MLVFWHCSAAVRKDIEHIDSMKGSKDVVPTVAKMRFIFVCGVRELECGAVALHNNRSCGNMIVTFKLVDGGLRCNNTGTIDADGPHGPSILLGV